jgi:hypothetical protein
MNVTVTKYVTLYSETRWSYGLHETYADDFYDTINGLKIPIK